MIYILGETGQSIKRACLIAILAISLLSCGGGSGNGDDNSAAPTLPELPAQPIALNFPDDFPLENQSVIGNGMNIYFVDGISSSTSYTVKTLHASGNIDIFISDIDGSQQLLCGAKTESGNEICAATPTGNRLGITVENMTEETVSFTLDITEQGPESPGNINEGNIASPIALSFPGGLPYAGTVALQGDSYYRITGLTPGARYKVELVDHSNDITLHTYHDAFITTAKCDPDFSWNRRCVFVSDGDTASLHVSGMWAFLNGASYMLHVTHLSDADEFEGTWYQPLILNTGEDALPHLGKVDDYNSYYHLTGLTAGRTYTVELTSITEGATFFFYNPQNGESVGLPCNPDDRPNNRLEDARCTLTANSDALFIKVKDSNLTEVGARYILKLTPEPLAQGSLSAPLEQEYSGLLRYAASVDNSASYYHISGLTPGNTYTIRLTGNTFWQNQLTVYDGDASFSTAANCSASGYLYCVITMTNSSLYLKVKGPDNPPGRYFDLNVSPSAQDETNHVLVMANLPYAGQVNNWFSEYTLSGLTPNTLYSVHLSGATGVLNLSAWDTSISTIACGFSTTATAACTLDSGPNGSLRIRIGNATNDSSDPGGHFILDVKPAPILTAYYQDAGAAVPIPDNDANGVSRPIVVEDSTISIISNITVEVAVKHDYTSDLAMYLIAPDGRSIPLVEHVGISEFIATRFNDYAASNVKSSSDNRLGAIYRPAKPLHALNGMDANGTWTLKAVDDRDTNRSDAIGGMFYSWGISFE